MSLSKKPNQPTKHHYLPQFYLRGFPCGAELQEDLVIRCQ